MEFKFIHFCFDVYAGCWLVSHFMVHDVLLVIKLYYWCSLLIHHLNNLIQSEPVCFPKSDPVCTAILLGCCNSIQTNNGDV